MTNIKAAIYVRISSDRADEAGVGRQEEDSRAAAERLGWDVAHVYAENDTSAFRRQKVQLPGGEVAMRVIRPEFRNMLRDLASGTVGAVIAYDLDRIARDPRDLEDLIDVLEATSSQAKSVTGSLDLSTDAGVTMARVLTAMANKASRDTSRRVTRALEQQAERGELKGGGQRWYGFERDGRQVAAEASTLRRIAAEILAGRTCGQIAADLNAEGVPTATGVQWGSRTVAGVVKKPMTAGLRLYRGEIVGEAAGVTPIVPREQWERVRAELASRSPGTTSGLRRWLNGTLICDKCGAKMAGKSRGKSVPAYVCAARPRHGLAGCGRLAISAEPTEVTVAAWIVGYLARDDIADALTVGVSDDAAQAARTEAAADEAQLKELATMWGRKQLTTAEYLAARKEIEGRLAKWQGVVKAAMPQAVRDLYGASHIKPADAFEAMAPTQKQAVAGFLFPRGVAVAPHAGGLRGFDPSRLRIANSVPQ